MALARKEFQVQDAFGRAIAGATVTVRRETTGQPIEPIYSDRDGATPQSNPMTSDASGKVAWHSRAGAFMVTAVYGSTTQTYRYVPIGLAQESDVIPISAGAKWLFDSSTSMADPGAGDFRLNNATHASATAIAISATSFDLAAMLNALITWDDSTNTIKGSLRITKADDPSIFREYNLTGTITNNTTWVQATIAHVASNGTLAAGDQVVITFARAGNVGATGAAGASAGHPFTFSTTTSMADPGAGILRLNNAALASVTAIAIDASSAASGNPSVRNWWLTWDDSTNPTIKGQLYIAEIGSPQNFAVFDVTGVTDNTGWAQLAVSHVNSGGAFANADALSVLFVRTGDKGTDGAGTGDVVGPSGGVVDNEVAVYNSTTGKIIKSSGGVLISSLAQVGKQSIPIMAGAMRPKASGGATRAVYRDLDVLLFPNSAAARVRFCIPMPKGWNESTVSFKVFATPVSGSAGNVVWQMAAAAVSNDDVISSTADLSTGAQTVTDAWIANDDLHISPESSAMTIAGSPAEHDLVVFELWRDPAHASDTGAFDWYVLGIHLYYTTNAGNDA